MIREGKCGYLFKCGGIEQLASLMRKVFVDHELLRALKSGVRSQMDSWTSKNFADTGIEAVEVASFRKEPKES